MAGSVQLGQVLRRLLLGQLAEDDHAEHLILGRLGGVAGADQAAVLHHTHPVREVEDVMQVVADEEDADTLLLQMVNQLGNHGGLLRPERRGRLVHDEDFGVERSEEHTSELQSLMRISYAGFCLKKKKNTTTRKHQI